MAEYPGEWTRYRFWDNLHKDIDKYFIVDGLGNYFIVLIDYFFNLFFPFVLLLEVSFSNSLDVESLVTSLTSIAVNRRTPRHPMNLSSKFGEI